MENNHTIINIGRQFGSGGKLVAMQVGEMLGINVYDNELISKAAQESGFSKELFERSDEKRSMFNISMFFGSNRFGNTQNYVGDNELFKIQSDVIRGIAEKGPAIFVGRCSNYILRDFDCLDIFISAPIEERIKRVSARTGLNEEEALTRIERQDRTRQTYYNFFTFGNWGAASDYDLCIDSSILGIEGSADFIVDFGRKAG
ncbi:MAG: cytidylate kinase-like family protein, partial [Bacteroidales bacterium]|nr:cytidylate kinase-like family protein [Bacteroidales bacterium]